MSLIESGQCLYCGSTSHWKDICRAYREDKKDGRIQMIQGRIYACVDGIGRRRIKTRVGVPQAECVQEAYAHLNSFQLRVPQSTQPMSFIRDSHLPKQPMVVIPGSRPLSPSIAQPISESLPTALPDWRSDECQRLLPEDIKDFLRWLDGRLGVQRSPDESETLVRLIRKFIATGQVPEEWYALMAG